MFDANLRELPNGSEFSAVFHYAEKGSVLDTFFKKGDSIFGVKSPTNKYVAALRTNNTETPWVVVISDEEDFKNLLVFDRLVPLDISERDYLAALNLMEKE